jgi:hypothetical protein
MEIHWKRFVYTLFSDAMHIQRSHGVHTPRLRTAIATLLMSALPVIAIAQAPTAPPAAPTPNPADTPNIRIGATIFADYTFLQSPTTSDADGNTIHSNAFNVGRSYINITGNISRIVNFRITPDISRETGTGSSLNGSLVFRIKYAFLQMNLDDWTGAGSWTRLGIQQTPIVDFEEGIYRYRFQGTVFSEREGFLTSSDAGASFHMNLPQNYGDVHVGVYNGEGYSRLEASDTKAFQIRGTLRPIPGNALLRGLRIHGFWDNDSYVKDADRKRTMAMVTFEHPHLNLGFDYLAASDQTLLSSRKRDARGFSFWATPRQRATDGLEGLLRVDRIEPDQLADAHRMRTIVGGAYWFPHQGTVSAALLLDYEQVVLTTNSPATVAPTPTQKRVAVHGLINF